MFRGPLIASVVMAGSASAGWGAVIVDAPLNADAQTRGGAQGSFNYGASTQLAADATSQVVYLRFTLPTFDPATLTDATLTLYSSTASLSGITLNLFGLNDDASTAGAFAGTYENWVEGSKAGTTADTGELTNANKPGGSPTTGTTRNRSTSLGAFTFTNTVRNTPVSFTNAASSPPNALIDFLKSDTNGNVTFLLTASAGVSFYSEEHVTAVDGAASGAPASSLVTTAVPEPGGSATLLFGAGTMAVARRRRAAR